MTSANVVFSGPVEAVKPLVHEAPIKAGQTLVGGNLVTLDAGEWAAAPADVGGNVHVIDMDTVGQKAVGAALTIGQSHPAFIPEVGKTYNIILAASQTIAKGASLVSNGGGTVKADTGLGDVEPLFTADEAITTGVGVTARIRARYNPTGVNKLV